MAASDRLRTFLDRQGVSCEALPHREAFTAQAVAIESHVDTRELAKVVALREERDGYVMVVLPAACRLDLTALRQATGRHRLFLVSEAEMPRLFPDCEVGAMPPFGSLYGMSVYADACLARSRDIVFQAGNHHEVMRLPYAVWERLVHPTVGEYCLHEREKLLSG